MPKASEELGNEYEVYYASYLELNKNVNQCSLLRVSLDREGCVFEIVGHGGPQLKARAASLK